MAESPQPSHHQSLLHRSRLLMLRQHELHCHLGRNSLVSTRQVRVKMMAAAVKMFHRNGKAGEAHQKSAIRIVIRVNRWKARIPGVTPKANRVIPGQTTVPGLLQTYAEALEKLVIGPISTATVRLRAKRQEPIDIVVRETLRETTGVPRMTGLGVAGDHQEVGREDEMMIATGKGKVRADIVARGATRMGDPRKRRKM